MFELTTDGSGRFICFIVSLTCFFVEKKFRLIVIAKSDLLLLLQTCIKNIFTFRSKYAYVQAINPYAIKCKQYCLKATASQNVMKIITFSPDFFHLCKFMCV